jgi:ABC-type oligopeptide transport system substrate-binding subunit
MRKFVVLAAAVAVAATLSLAACSIEDTSTGSGSGKNTNNTKNDKETSSVEMTPGQEQAVGAAESYLDFKAFSEQGLIDQSQCR